MFIFTILFTSLSTLGDNKRQAALAGGRNGRQTWSWLLYIPSDRRASISMSFQIIRSQYFTIKSRYKPLSITHPTQATIEFENGF